jgi:excisionase family DNA binding protein
MAGQWEHYFLDDGTEVLNPIGPCEEPAWPAARLARVAKNRTRTKPVELTAPSSTDPDRLKSEREACERIGCSRKTLLKHIRSGALRYVDTGHGKARQRRKFTDQDLNDFITKQTRTEISQCQSLKTRARRIGGSTSNTGVIAFSDRPKSPPGAKRKP